jgi:hypothetical protein
MLMKLTYGLKLKVDKFHFCLTPLSLITTAHCLEELSKIYLSNDIFKSPFGVDAFAATVAAVAAVTVVIDV